MSKKMRTVNLADAIDEAVAELQALGEACREQYDNMPENMQSGERATMLSEAADVLEGIETPDTDLDAIKDLSVTLRDYGARKRWSRNDIRNAEVETLSLAYETLQDFIDKRKPAMDVEDLEELAETLQAIMTEAEGVSFS